MIGEQTSRTEDNSPQEKSQAVKYSNFFNYLESLKKNNRSKSLEKQLLAMRIEQLNHTYDDVVAQGGESYLEHNACTRGDFEYRENLVKTCGLNVVWFQDVKSGDHYLHELACRKQWCPTCGGKNGTIHKSRMHSLLSRIDPRKYNMRQFVFTVPDELRDEFRSRDALNELFAMARRVVEKNFGCAELDKYGHIKRYKLKKPVVSYLHVFGDQDRGVFKPHVNVHILENLSVLLKLTPEQLQKIRKDWFDQLCKYCKKNDVSYDGESAVMHYKMRIGERRVIHALKYMSRPYGVEDYEAIKDLHLKKLLVSGLNGFLYMRYWAELSNCVYKDNMDLSEIKSELESKHDLQLKPLFIAPFDIILWGAMIEKIDDGFYRIKRKVV